MWWLPNGKGKQQIGMPGPIRDLNPSHGSHLTAVWPLCPLPVPWKTWLPCVTRCSEKVIVMDYFYLTNHCNKIDPNMTNDRGTSSSTACPTNTATWLSLSTAWARRYSNASMTRSGYSTTGYINVTGPMIPHTPWQNPHSNEHHRNQREGWGVGQRPAQMEWRLMDRPPINPHHNHGQPDQPKTVDHPQSKEHQHDCPWHDSSQQKPDDCKGKPLWNYCSNKGDHCCWQRQITHFQFQEQGHYSRLFMQETSAAAKYPGTI